MSSGRARAGRSTSLRILCDQLEHTQTNLARLNAEIEQLLNTDPGVKGLQQVPEFGQKTLAVLRAEVGDVQRFSRTDEVIAYGGMDIQIKESGLWKGKAKLSKRGSGPALAGPLYDGFALHSSGRFGLWCLLSAFGGARSQDRLGSDGRDAQIAGGGRSRDCCMREKSMIPTRSVGAVRASWPAN